MVTLILNILLQYAGVGLVCAALIDIVIRTTKSSEPFTLGENTRNNLSLACDCRYSIAFFLSRFF
jgi:hypothetical protein